MPDTIVPRTPTSSALSAEHYQTYEMALEHDDVLSGDNIAQIRSYAAYARAQAQAIHKTIAATSGIDDVAAIKAEATETAQTFAKVGIYADQRIGELLRELPTKQGKRTDLTSVGTPTKVEAEREAGISHATSIDLQTIAANPDVVQAVLDKAEKDGTIPSRAQVLRAIKERDELRDEVSVLEAQNDRLYEQVQAAGTPKVVTREVVPEKTARRITDLERGNQRYSEENQQLRRQLEETRRELDKARDVLGMSQATQDVRRDVAYLITATNNYVRQYGGLTWTVQKLAEVDEPTLDELRKAVLNLATFSNALVASLEEINGNH